MHKVRAIAALLVSGGLAVAASAATSAATVLRPSPEFALAQPGGSTILLSSLQGKVVVLEFLFIKSAHCLRVARMLSKLHEELGPRGLQALGVVFDPPNAEPGDGQLIAAIADSIKLTFPLGYTSKESVDSYLDRARDEVLNIPQIVVIDRAGTIRAASGGRGGDASLENESSLRQLLDALLREEAPAGLRAK